MRKRHGTGCATARRTTTIASKVGLRHSIRKRNIIVRESKGGGHVFTNLFGYCGGNVTLVAARRAMEESPLEGEGQSVGACSAQQRWPSRSLGNLGAKRQHL